MTESLTFKDMIASGPTDRPKTAELDPDTLGATIEDLRASVRGLSSSDSYRIAMQMKRLVDMRQFAKGKRPSLSFLVELIEVLCPGQSLSPTGGRCPIAEKPNRYHWPDEDEPADVIYVF